jgi:hypothetical protein
MSSESPPSGWLVDTGVWGTDCDREETLNQTGNHSLHLKSTAVATKLVGPWIPVRGGWNNTYSAWALLQASSIAGGNTVTVKCQGYQDDRSTTTTAINVINASVLGAANTWEHWGDTATFASNTRWARFEIEKAAQSFDVYIDFVNLEKFPPGGRVAGAAVTIASGAGWSTPNMPTQAWFSDVDFDAATERITVYIPGIYIITASTEWSDLVDGDYVEMRIVENAAGVPISTYGTSCPVGAADTTRLIASASKELVPNDTLELQVRQQTGNDLSLDLYSLNVTRIPALPQ